MGCRVLKTTIAEITAYWIKNKPFDETELNFDWADAEYVCWNCGRISQKRLDGKGSRKDDIKLQRCHIVPDSLGGGDVPSNYVLLCKKCHIEAPNVKNKYAMWEWIHSNKLRMGMYNSYEIEPVLLDFINNYNEEIPISEIDVDLFVSCLIELGYTQTSNHFGERVNKSTLRWLLKETYKLYYDKVNINKQIEIDYN